MQYFQNNQSMIDLEKFAEFHQRSADYADHLSYCFKNPVAPKDLKLKTPCLSSYGGPTFPWTVLGGYQNVNYENSSALLITFLLNNFKNETFQKMALAWEKKVLEYLKGYENDNLTITFKAERSIEDEINRESHSDIKTIIISYTVMFVYVSIMLGYYRKFSTILIDSKVTLGLSGVLIVVVSVTSSLGFFSYVGIPATLIIIEVVPFLVLAVGVDNIFILVQCYQVLN